MSLANMLRRKKETSTTAKGGERDGGEGNLRELGEEEGTGWLFILGWSEYEPGILTPLLRHTSASQLSHQIKSLFFREFYVQ